MKTKTKHSYNIIRIVNILLAGFTIHNKTNRIKISKHLKCMSIKELTSLQHNFLISLLDTVPHCIVKQLNMRN
jgi:hypothetical protein